MDKVKAEYIAGGVSIRELAEEHGISEDTLEKRAAKEGWTKLRRKTGEKTAEKLVEAISDAKVKKIETTMNRLLRENDRASKQLRKHATVITERYTDEDTGREIVKVTKTWEDTDVVDAAKLKTLVQTTKDLLETAKRLKGDGDKAQEIRVTFAGDLEELAE